jgi:hypothetical protein
MRLLIAAGIALAATTALAFADDDMMTSRYGNTVIAKSAKGPEVHLYYNADHTFTGKVIGMNYPLKGTWEMKGGDQVCATYDPAPPGMTNPVCSHLDPHKVGDTWTAGDRDVSLVAGIQ